MTEEEHYIIYGHSLLLAKLKKQALNSIQIMEKMLFFEK